MTALNSVELSARLEQLERSERRWRRLFLGTAGIVVAGMASALAPVPVTARQAAPNRAPNAAAAPKTAAAQANPGEPADASALYYELHRISHRAEEMMERSFRMGAPVVDMAGQVVAWSHSLLAADLYRTTEGTKYRTTNAEVNLALAEGPPNPDRVAAFREHFNRVKYWEDRLRPLAADGRYPALSLLALQSSRLEAEAWLSRELNRKPR